MRPRGGERDAKPAGRCLNPVALDDLGKEHRLCARPSSTRSSLRSSEARTADDQRCHFG